MKNELENIHHSKINNLNFLLVDMTYREPHLHFDMELAFVLEGKGQVRTQEKQFEISEGQGIILNSCQVHEFLSDDTMKLLIMQFSTNIFEIIFPQLDKIYFENQPFYLVENPEAVKFLLQASLSYFQGRERILRVHGFTSLLLDEMLQLCPYKVLNISQQNKLMDLQERIERISTYIHEHYDEKLALDDLASREGFSRTYFSHFFKNNFGITFKEYVDNLRCEKARNLLVSTSETLLSISYMCGFSDIRSLNNAFLKCWGVLPKDYRKGNCPHQPQTEISFNQDEIDNQVIYSDEGSYELLRYYCEKYFSVAHINC